MHNRQIKVGITHGDINGVGYEIILKSLAEEGITDLFTPVIFGVPSIIEKAKETFQMPNFNVNIISDASEARNGKINLVSLKSEPELAPGEIRKDAGNSAVEALNTAAEALKRGDIDVLVTAPISKEAVHSETFDFTGHTEFLSEKIGGGNDALMILCSDTLRVALLTIHIPVSKIADEISEDNIIKAVKQFEQTLKKDFGIVRPSIAVLSLNPHAGDGGVIGDEEHNIITPAIENLIGEGVLAFGPFPADGFFGNGTYKQFDGVLAMYHDQGLAPFKTIAYHGGVNFTGGLPFIRTSPDHGTAFDIAWQGKADATSMKEAIYMAIDIFRRRKIYEEASSNPLKKYVSERPERLEREGRSMPKNDIQEIDD